MRSDSSSSDASPAFHFADSDPGDQGDIVWLWPSDILEFLFCPRFTFFERVLKIPQHTEKRHKVLRGRQLHARRLTTNIGYLRRRQGVVRVMDDVPLTSHRLRLKGVVDQILFLNDGSAAPLDHKFARYPGYVFRLLKVQSWIYGLMITEQFGTPVHRGFIVYARSGNKLVELPHPADAGERIERLLSRVRRIVEEERFPRSRRLPRRCADCCYRNICPP